MRRRVGWLGCGCWLVAAVVAAGAASAMERRREAKEGRARRGPSLRVEHVELVAAPEPAVRIRLSAPGIPAARTLPASGTAPARLYVDVPDAVLGPALTPLLGGAGPVRRVRVGQFGPRTARVVIELAQALPFALDTQARTVTVTLGRGEALTAATSTPPAARAARPPRPRQAPAVAAASAARAAVAAPPAPAVAVEPAPAAGLVGAPAPEAPAPPPVAAGDPAPDEAPAAAAAPLVGMVKGHLFAWPSLDAAPYDDPAAEPFRRAMARWQTETAAAAPREAPGSPAARYLAADLAFLDATAGRGAFLDAAEAYEAALRAAPDFPDAARAWFVLGRAYLALGFAPEAGAAFGEVERRFPESPLVPEARVGAAAALRLRRRPEAARRLLDDVLAHASEDVRCRARVEAALLAQASDGPSAAVARFADLAAHCPHALETPGLLLRHAEALVLAGDRDGARALLAAPREPRDDDEEARLHLLAGTLADTPAGARVEYELALDKRGTPAAAEARMRIALLDVADRPERAAATLGALAERPGPVPLRAAILGEAADASARAGRFEEALALLDRAASLGPEGEAQADGRRRELLGRWLAALGARDDHAGVVTVYAAYTTAVDELASAEDRLVVARALGRLGLARPALRLLERIAQGAPGRAELGAEIAEQALAAGDAGTARASAAALAPAAPPEAAARLHGTAARAALAAGDLEGALAEAGRVGDPGVRAAVAAALLAEPDGVPRARALLEPVLAAPDVPPRVWLVAGAAAAAAGAWTDAAEAYGRALATGDAAVRLEAATGVARAARARGDAAAAAAALGEAAAGGEIFRRAAVAADRAFRVE